MNELTVAKFNLEKNEIEWKLVETDSGFLIDSVTTDSHTTIGVVEPCKGGGLRIKSKSGRKGRPFEKKVSSFEELLRHFKEICNK